MTGLRVVNIRKSFGRTMVLDGISFEVREGEFVVLLGPSGCGKTTMLRIIAGLETQDEGQIYIGQREVSSLSPKDRDVAMVFQSYALYPHMSVYENMAFPLKMRKAKKEEIDRKVKAVAEMLNIKELLDRKPRQLSGGQRQRVAIGRAIVREPAVFLFDEPLSNLDAQLRASMRVELRQLHRRIGVTSVYVTHDQVEAMTLADRIIVLKDGRIQQVGTPEQIYKRPASVFVATFVGSPRMNLIEGRLKLVDGEPVFVSGLLRLPLRLKEPERYRDKKIVVGIRPEAILPGNGPFKAEITHIEPLGAEKIVHLDLYGHKIVAKTGPEASLSSSESVPVGLQLEGLHIFFEGNRVE